MKKAAISMIMALLLLSASSCSFSLNKYLDRPKETNLAYWITQTVTEDDFKDCTLMPSGFGMDVYLDGRYSGEIAEDNSVILPDVYVCYSASGYPDAVDHYCVTEIDITDPAINIYGLTMNSTTETVKKTMTSHGFRKLENGNYTKNNVVFSFSKSRIYIHAPSTNKLGVMY
jgi:hypothetical protein